ncbi:MAG TPA: pantoate--beta-alanine ligase [Chitinophagales bacterium]|nr:pantoate--beta-alanine ligase [Chitinophagales bacterium]
MILFKKAAAVTAYLASQKATGKSIGFIPTMGALHRGHISLVERAKGENDLVICSIFVNPTQFNDPKDLEKYPRPIEKDIEMLVEANCNLLFLPAVGDIYPQGLLHLKTYDLGHLENFLEGASRPGHFNGVANVVDRFLQIVNPDRLYLGQKDFQQVKVLEHLVKLKEYSTHIIICPILREENGLAMSSRNVRLTEEQRKQAAIISQTLFFARDHYREYEPGSLQTEVIRRIETFPDARVDYLEFCDTDAFQIIHDWKDARHIVVVTAVMVGNVRLLDNVVIQ